MLFFKNLTLVVLACVLTLLCGCTVEPLYRQTPQVSMTIDSFSYSKRNSFGLSEKLASIVVEEPSDRFGQMVRNHLLFLLYGNGRSKPAAPAYRLILKTSASTRESMKIEVDRAKKSIGRYSMGTIVSMAVYTLQDMKNAPVAKGSGFANVSFERLRQEYATLQAEKDAQKRAATELAERIFMSLSQKLLKL
ncbi:LPS assembly lipoprotein LptE [Bartonella sp. CB60]|uniref:LPS assembly lipoprotein LptE n=1 Tax=Bartonella sp. CB60 TaxID=3113619 RepID=UPI00300E4925